MTRKQQLTLLAGAARELTSSLYELAKVSAKNARSPYVISLRKESDDLRTAIEAAAREAGWDGEDYIPMWIDYELAKLGRQ